MNISTQRAANAGPDLDSTARRIGAVHTLTRDHGAHWTAVACPACHAERGAQCAGVYVCRARRKAIDHVIDHFYDAEHACGAPDLTEYEHAFATAVGGIAFEWTRPDDDDGDDDEPHSTRVDALALLDSIEPAQELPLILSVQIEARRQALQSPPESPIDPVLPECHVDGNLSRMVAQAERVIANVDGLYWRRGPHGGELVRVLREIPSVDGLRRDAAAPTIAALTSAGVRMELADNARWTRLAKGNRIVEAGPPRDVVEGLMSRQDFPRPYLAGVSPSPIVRRDLSVCETPGYDVSTCLIYAPARAMESLPDLEPAEAVRLLLDVVADFPFKDDAHRAAWIAAVLTPIARAAFDGSAPMFVFDAATPGTGKTLLVDVAGLIATGSLPAKQSQVGNEEMEKRILALALSGDAIVAIDNVHSEIGGGALEAAITNSAAQGRTLGKSEMRSVPMRAVWYATGNNVETTRDMQRRVIPIRLVANEERPEERSGFRHPDLLRHVRENRASLFAAALAVLRAPRSAVPLLGSFEDWSRVVCGAIVGAGLPNPLDARAELADRGDPGREALGALLAAVAAHEKPVTARDMLAIPGVLGPARELAKLGDHDMVTSTALAMVLRRYRDRVIDGRRLEGTPRQGTMVWQVR